VTGIKPDGTLIIGDETPKDDLDRELENFEERRGSR
jgi:hypothetical protein